MCEGLLVRKQDIVVTGEVLASISGNFSPKCWNVSRCIFGLAMNGYEHEHSTDTWNYVGDFVFESGQSQSGIGERFPGPDAWKFGCCRLGNVAGLNAFLKT